MISESVKAECQIFCSENESFLNDHSFNGNSIEHLAVRFIQCVAFEVQIPQSDKFQENDCETFSLNLV